MKVALVCPYDLGRFGGVQDQVIKLATWLRDAGHEATVVGPGTAGPEGAVLLGPARVVRANGSDVPIALDPATSRRVVEAVRGVDVVHVHEPLMPMVSLAAMRKAESPIVATFHAGPSPALSRSYRLAKRGVAKLLRRAGAVTAVSPVAARSVEHIAAVRLVPNGLDLDLYPSLERNPKRVVFVGRNEPRKGLAVLLEAWPEVIQAVPDAELVVVGADAVFDGPGRVEFLGRISDEHKRGVVATSGVACSPNLGGESFGIVVVEAMAAGCAVVASALPGFVHAAGDAALLVKPADPDAVAWGLIKLLTDDAAADGLRKRAAARVQRYGREAVLGGYVAAYESAICG